MFSICMFVLFLFYAYLHVYICKGNNNMVNKKQKKKERRKLINFPSKKVMNWKNALKHPSKAP